DPVRGLRRAERLPERSPALLEARAMARARVASRRAPLRRARGALRDSGEALARGQGERRLPGSLVSVEDARPRETFRGRLSVGADRAHHLGTVAERRVRREELARVVTLHDHGVPERDRVVLAGPADVGHAARGHDLETDQTEWLLFRVR